jgi:hypothetical protein
MPQKVHLPTSLASLNNDHNFDLRTCYVGVRFSSRPNLVPTKPLRLRIVAWRSSLVVNLSSTTLGRAPVAKAEACAVIGHCRVATTTLARNLIWPCNNSVLSCCTNSFFDFTFLGLEAHEAQVEIMLFLFGRIGQGLHIPADHSAHILNYHRGPFGLLRKRSLGCDNRSHLTLH